MLKRHHFVVGAERVRFVMPNQKLSERISLWTHKYTATLSVAVEAKMSKPNVSEKFLQLVRRIKAENDAMNDARAQASAGTATPITRCNETRETDDRRDL